MSVDRYTRIVLTIIALELGWIAAKGVAVPLSAQRAAERGPTPVVITGIEFTADRPDALPMVLTGTVGAVRVMTESPLKVEVDRPVVVETADNPLLIRSVQAEPAPRPGE